MNSAGSFSGDLSLHGEQRLTLAGLVWQYPEDLLFLPEVWLESLLSGWQENDISHHPRQLISACPALRFSAGAAENAQVKGSPALQGALVL